MALLRPYFSLLRSPNVHVFAKVCSRCFNSTIATTPKVNVALVGRPNVGKTTLFNRLTRQRGIVDAKPGTTRDRRSALGTLMDIQFNLIDTGGMTLSQHTENSSMNIEKQILSQCEVAIQDAQVVFFLVDARTGLTQEDRHFAHWLRVNLPEPPATTAAVHIVVNKSEKFDVLDSMDESWLDMQSECWGLGLGGPPLAISAAAGEGMAELYSAIRHHIPTPDTDAQQTVQATTDSEKDSELPISMSIMGRPNVGKSTLLNRLMGEQVSVTDPLPGATRDSVATRLRHGQRALQLIDTAGISRGSRGKSMRSKKAMVARQSVASAIRSLRYCNVVVLLIDGTMGKVPRQDLALGTQALNEGRGLVVAVNKCDDIPSFDLAQEGVAATLAKQLPQAGDIPVVAMSGLTGKGTETLLPAVCRVYDSWTRRVTTNMLNRWLEAFHRVYPPPTKNGKIYRVKFITQVKTRPPTYCLFVNRSLSAAATPGAKAGPQLPANYRKSIESALRTEFDLHGVPLRTIVRAQKNPYNTKLPQTSNRGSDTGKFSSVKRKQFAHLIDNIEHGYNEN